MNFFRERNFRRTFGLLGFYVVLLSLISPILLSRIRSNDVWKALYTGRYLDWFSRFPHHSTFTFSPVRDFIARDASTWLGNLLFYWIHEGAGLVGLQGLRIFLLLLTILMLHSIVRFRVRTTDFVYLLFFSFAIDQKLHVRTALVAVPATVCVLSIWFQAHRRKNRCWLWFLPPLLVLWSNMHPSYMLGLGYVLILTVGESVEYKLGRSRKQWVRTLWVIFSVSMISVLFVKPLPDQLFLDQFRAGLNGVLKLARVNSFFVSLYEIVSGGFVLPGSGVESGLFRGRTDYGYVYDNLDLPLVQFCLMFGIFGVIGFLRRYRSVRLPELFLLIVVLPFGLRYTRTVAYLPLTILPLLLGLSARSSPDLSLKIRGWSPGRCAFLAVGGVMVLFVIVHTLSGRLDRLTGNPRLQVGWGKHPMFSDTVPDYILQYHPDDRFLNPWGEGTYLIWKWWPYKKVYVDGKAVPYQNEFLKSFDSDWVIEQAFDYVVLWKYREKARYYRSNPKWNPIVEDSYMISFGRSL